MRTFIAWCLLCAVCCASDLLFLAPTGLTLTGHIRVADNNYVHVAAAEDTDAPSGQGLSWYVVTEAVLNASAIDEVPSPLTGFIMAVTTSATSSQNPVAFGEFHWDGDAVIAPSASAPTADAVADAVRIELAVELARLDVAMSTRAKAVPTIETYVPTLGFVPRPGAVSKKVRLSWVVRDVNGDLVDPVSNAINLSYTDPDSGALPTLPATATRASTGRYHADITVLNSNSRDQKLVVVATGTVAGVVVLSVGNLQYMATPPAQIIIGGNQ